MPPSTSAIFHGRQERKPVQHQMALPALDYRAPADLINPSRMYQDLKARIGKFPAEMLLTYIDGPKGKSLTDAERESLRQLLTPREPAAPATAPSELQPLGPRAGTRTSPVQELLAAHREFFTEQQHAIMLALAGGATYEDVATEQGISVGKLLREVAVVTALLGARLQ